MCRNIYLLTLIALTLFFSASVNGQDSQLSQFYAAPIATNPAYTGITPEHRFIANYRLLWPNLPSVYSTYAFSYDYNMKRLNSGIGILAMTDQSGSVSLRETQVLLSYSYKLKLAKGKWILVPAIQFGIQSRSIDREKLLFGDQIALGSQQTGSLDPSLSSLRNPTFVDLGAGALIYNETYWLGASALHINQPNVSFIGSDTILPMRINVHGGLRFTLVQGQSFGASRNKSSLAPSFLFKTQGQSSQLDIGSHFNYDPIIAGAWFRGLPITNPANNLAKESIILLFGLRFSQVEVGYTYDFTISELGASSGGAHEVSLKYILYNLYSSAPKPKRYLPCPTF